ncbi:MAG: SIR2 family protein [Candidatus Aceula meridiana]|nr:SIR2 family protein [Candidatus Aceula meridiana]
MDILPVPPLDKYPHLLDAFIGEKVIVFIGAGLPAIWGCKRWYELAAALIESCHERDMINYWTKSNLLKKFRQDPRKIMTIAKQILDSDYLSTLKSHLNVSEKKRDKNPHLFKNLYSMDAIFMSTNVDNIFSGLFDEDDIIFKTSDFGVEKLTAGKLFQLHGSLEDESSLVMTISDYVQRYRDPKMKELLKQIFVESDYKILFVGYGMDEMEIIDYVIEKYTDEVKRSIDKYYILMPVFSNEEELIKHESKYFQEMNMSVIPYAIDEKGYEQLGEVVSEWSQEIVKAREGKRDEFYKYIDLIEENT